MHVLSVAPAVRLSTHRMTHFRSSFSRATRAKEGNIVPSSDCEANTTAMAGAVGILKMDLVGVQIRHFKSALQCLGKIGKL